MKYGPSTTNADLADAIDELHNSLNERNLAELEDLELLSEAATRIREQGDVGEIDFDSDDVCPGCGVPLGDLHKDDCEEAEEHD